MLCVLCENLSIGCLIELAKIEFSAHIFPRKSFYAHHDSFSALHNAARSGCELCQYICNGLRGTPTEDFESHRRRESEIKNAETEGRPTDIKIAINARHLYGCALDANEVVLFDTVMVQVGLIQDYFVPRDDDEDELTYIPTLEFLIYTSEGESLDFDGFKIGRIITDPDLGAEPNVQLVRKWLQQCEKHEKCPSIHPPQLPTRVIDVGIEDNYKDMKLFVTGSIRGNYFTLSHCWGGIITPLLTKETLIPWQESMDFSELPANFKDAISITKQLGLRYLWIDALCIIQNSTEDWNVESKKMGTLYHDALVMIAATTSIKSTEGFLNCLPAFQSKDEMFDLKLSSDPHNTTTVKLASQIPENEDETLRRLFIAAPLHKRGWCLQETVIAPRILHFGSKMMYWQCLTGFKSADGIPPPNRFPEDEFYTNFDAIIHLPKADPTTPTDLEEARNEFHKLVVEYSCRKLTYSTDKFPAFSGIARLMQPAFPGGTYVAGVWTTDLRGLLWYDAFCPHVVPYRAPSWSWAVTDEPITISSAQAKLSDGVYDAEVFSYEQTPKTENLFGEVTSAHLMIRARTKTFLRSEQNIGISWPEKAAGTANFDDVWVPGENWLSHVFELAPQPGQILGSLLSIINGEGKEQKEWEVDESMLSEKEYLAVLIQAYHIEERGTGASEGTALVVEKVEGTENTYVRVGILELAPVAPPGFANMIEDCWEERIVKLI